MIIRHLNTHLILQRSLVIALLLFSAIWARKSSAVMADDVEFRASAPSQVVIGKPFQLTYSVNQRSRNLQTPDMNGFDILAGPYSSTSSSTSFINGRRTSSFSQTYTYTLMANTEGTFTLAPATIQVDGEEYTSNGVKITVLPADEEPVQNAGSQASQTQSSSGQSSSNAGGSVSSENIFIRTVVSKTRVHEQEALLLSYKLYFAGVDVAQFTNNTKIPEFTGFLKQELEQGEIQTELEHYNGRNYQTATLYRTLLYPQHAGDIKIDPASFEAVLRVQTRAQVRSIFDDFFGSYTNVTKLLTAPGITIHAEGLPAGKPAGFSGGVGEFTMTPSISATELKTNEAVTIKLNIQGSGNMKLIKMPIVEWPEGFEEYDPKVSNNFKTTAHGVSGTKSIEYLAIPRASGDYTIPAIHFSYFDINSNSYRTISSPEYTLHIAKGAGETDNSAVQQYSGTVKEDIHQLGTDIRYINTSALQTTDQPQQQFATHLILLCYLLPLLLAILLFIAFSKRIRENSDLTKVRYKKANKVAQKRLKAAAKLLSDNNKTAFYEEIERAAWSYLSDRLSIPTSELNKENITSILREKGVSEAIITDVNQVLSTAEFARYAPSSEHGMEDLFAQTTTLINNLESQHL